MIAQRPAGSAPVVQASAEAPPFADDSFDATMAVLTAHHWADRGAGLAEMSRVPSRTHRDRHLRPFRAQRPLDRRDYFPEMPGLKRRAARPAASWRSGSPAPGSPPSQSPGIARTSFSRRFGRVRSCSLTRRSCARCGSGRASPRRHGSAAASDSSPTSRAGPGDERYGHLREAEELEGGRGSLLSMCELNFGRRVA